MSFKKYLLYLGQPSGSSYQLLKNLKEELPKNQIVSIKDLKWHKTFMSADGVAYYPNNCLLLNFQTFCDKEILEFMKDYGYDVDSYYSSRDLIKENKTGLFNLLKRENSIVFLPDFYYNTRPPSKLFLSYERTGVTLCKELSKYNDLCASLPIEEDFLPVYVVSSLFGNIISVVLAILENKKVILYLDKDHTITEQISGRTLACSSYTNYEHLPREIKNKIKRAEEYLEPLHKEIEELTEYLSYFLMIGRAEYTLTILDGLVYLLDVNYDHPITYSMLKVDEYLNKEIDIILKLLSIEGSFFNGYE